MGLNPHLINLMAVRERQRLEPTRTAESAAAQAVEERSFAEALEESLRSAGQKTETSGFRETLESDIARQTPNIAEAETMPTVTAAQMINPDRLLRQFFNEHDLALAAQRLPDSRYRTNPDDDTSGEQETRANVRPID